MTGAADAPPPPLRARVPCAAGSATRRDDCNGSGPVWARPVRKWPCDGPLGLGAGKSRRGSSPPVCVCLVRARAPAPGFKSTARPPPFASRPLPARRGRRWPSAPSVVPGPPESIPPPHTPGPGACCKVSTVAERRPRLWATRSVHCSRRAAIPVE